MHVSKADNSLLGRIPIHLIEPWTVYLEETRRFLRTPVRSVTSEVLTILIVLFLVGLLVRPDHLIRGVPFITFLAPGLLTILIIQSVFDQTSTSTSISKISCNTIERLPTLRVCGLIFGIVVAGITRGLLTTIIAFSAMHLLIEGMFRAASLPHVTFYILSGSLMSALLGVICRIWMKNSHQVSTVNNFAITPLSILSGTFYSIYQLPDQFQAAGFVNFLNPFFHLTDGLRFAFIGLSDGSVIVGMVVATTINVGLWVFALGQIRGRSPRSV